MTEREQEEREVGREKDEANTSIRCFTSRWSQQSRLCRARGRSQRLQWSSMWVARSPTDSQVHQNIGS